MSTDTQTAAVDPSARFAFGANWARFLRDLNDERIERAASSLTAMLQRDSLNGVTFLDIRFRQWAVLTRCAAARSDSATVRLRPAFRELHCRTSAALLPNGLTRT